MLGKAVPDFSLPSTAGSNFRPTKERGKKLVLYFYPKDNTPGCATEGAAFRDLHSDFAKANCSIFGISRDSLRSHQAFKAKIKFETACRLFGVIKLKNMYGRKVRGIERSTFPVNEEGVVAREWRGVKVPGHVQEVLNFAKAL